MQASSDERELCLQTKAFSLSEVQTNCHRNQPADEKTKKRMALNELGEDEQRSTQEIGRLRGAGIHDSTCTAKNRNDMTK